MEANQMPNMKGLVEEIPLKGIRSIFSKFVKKIFLMHPPWAVQSPKEGGQLAREQARLPLESVSRHRAQFVPSPSRPLA